MRFGKLLSQTHSSETIIPYQDSIYGDWFSNYGRIHHTGEVFLNGKSLYEKEKLEKVITPVPYERTLDTEGSTYTWYCESDAE